VFFYASQCTTTNTTTRPWQKKGDTTLLSTSLLNLDQVSKFFHSYIQQEICNKIITQHNLNVLLHYLVKYYCLLTSLVFMLRHYLTERLTGQTADVWQVATVMTEACHNNDLHWPWLKDPQISKWRSQISTNRLTDVVLVCFAPIFLLCCHMYMEPTFENFWVRLIQIPFH